MQLSLCLISFCAIAASYVNAFPIGKAQLQVVTRDLNLPESIVGREITLPIIEHSARSSGEADHQARGIIDEIKKILEHPLPKASRRDSFSSEDALQARDLLDKFRDIFDGLRAKAQASRRDSFSSEDALQARDLLDKFKDIFDGLRAEAQASRRDTADSEADLLARGIFDKLKKILEHPVPRNARREPAISDADLEKLFEEAKDIEAKLKGNGKL